MLDTKNIRRIGRRADARVNDARRFIGRKAMYCKDSAVIASRVSWLGSYQGVGQAIRRSL